jgi:hypothetical protein
VLDSIGDNESGLQCWTVVVMVIVRNRTVKLLNSCGHGDSE